MNTEKSRPAGHRTAPHDNNSTDMEVTAPGRQQIPGQRLPPLEQVIIAPPEYGSPEFYALPGDDPRRDAALVRAADCWAALCSSPHVADVLLEFREWMRRQDFRDTSSAICALEADRWRAIKDRAPLTREADRWLTYGELDRRRAAPAWVARCHVPDENTGHPCNRVLDALDHPPTGRETCPKPVVNGAHPKRNANAQAQRRAA